jgi:hypothetical protein
MTLWQTAVLAVAIAVSVAGRITAARPELVPAR